MFRTLGPPTFFITLTADDMNWPDLLYVLAKRAGMNISMKDVDSMSSEQKCELLCSDPVTTARYFLRRFQKFIAFMKKLVKTNWRYSRLLLASGISVARKSPHTFTVVGKRCS